MFNRYLTKVTGTNHSANFYNTQISWLTTLGEKYSGYLVIAYLYSTAVFTSPNTKVCAAKLLVKF